MPHNGFIYEARMDMRENSGHWCNVRKWCITIFPQVASLSLEMATFGLIAFPATEQTGEVFIGLTQFVLPPQDYILDMMCALTVLTKRPNFLSCYCI